MNGYYKIMSPEKLKHLEFIQNVITRMNSNSFTIKGWNITIVSAFLALYASSKNIDFLLAGLPAIFIFWYLDSFYLTQERRYRELYSKVVKNKNDDAEVFDMNASVYANKTLISSFFSLTILPLYGGMVFFLIVIYFYVRCF